MRNPYEVLGVKEGAGKDEIKAAYRELVKKYHPDKHQNNPLGELAKEKMQEINEVYDFLMNKTESGGSYSGFSGSSGSSRRRPEFNEVRKEIDRGNLSGAEERLRRTMTRDAEWYYLSGMIQLRRGWYNEALNNIQTAVKMEPSNGEYQNALNSIMNSAGGYQQNSYQRGYADSQSQLCQCMSLYCCADACCDCI
jgi:molecular chaperone DnaJ